MPVIQTYWGTDKTLTVNNLVLEAWAKLAQQLVSEWEYILSILTRVNDASDKGYQNTAYIVLQLYTCKNKISFCSLLYKEVTKTRTNTHLFPKNESKVICTGFFSTLLLQHSFIH